MTYKRILTIQDISCVGQCSLTVALPILSACGFETCILPSAVLSTHTGGFTGYTFRDLTEDIPGIQTHWEKEKIIFDAIYTGYLGSTKQIDYVENILNLLRKEDGISIVDPAMADNGKLYPGFDSAFVDRMKELVAKADYVLPNITEACLLTNTDYQSEYDENFIDEILNRVVSLGAKTVVLTGVSYKQERTGVVVFEGNKKKYYEHRKIEKGCHGTGDVFASAFAGVLLSGKDPLTAASLAADYTVRCIENTIGDKDHWYGVKFEPMLPWLIDVVQG